MSSVAMTSTALASRAANDDPAKGDDLLSSKQDSELDIPPKQRLVDRLTAMKQRPAEDDGGPSRVSEAADKAERPESHDRVTEAADLSPLSAASFALLSDRPPTEGVAPDHTTPKSAELAEQATAPVVDVPRLREDTSLSSLASANKAILKADTLIAAMSELETSTPETAENAYEDQIIWSLPPAPVHTPEEIITALAAVGEQPSAKPASAPAPFPTLATGTASLSPLIDNERPPMIIERAYANRNAKAVEQALPQLPGFCTGLLLSGILGWFVFLALRSG